MDKLRLFFKSFFSIFAVMRLTGMSTRDPLSIILFMIFLYIYSKFDKDSVRTRVMSVDIPLSSILSVLFSLSTLCARYGVILGDLTSTLFCVIVLGASAVGLFTIFFHLCVWILQASDSLSLTDSAYRSALIPYITFAFCIVCWIPYFLFEYPGVMTPDSVNQFCQAMGVYELSNHHSIVHTGIIGICYNIGYSLFGNIYAAIAFYTIVQMAFLAFAASYVVRTLQKTGAITPVIAIAILFYALMPYNIANAVTMLKDTFFAGFMSILSASLIRISIKGKSSWPDMAAYFVSSIMVCLLRGNGWYAFLLTLPFVLILNKKNLKVFVPVNIVLLIIVLFVKYPFMEIYEIKQPDYTESISIPVQQIARVIANGESLSESEYEYVSQIMDIEQVPLVYQSDVSDNIKNLIRQTGLEYLENTKSEFLKTWLLIGLKHPKAYFDAYVEQTVGFWYPDVDNEIGLSDGIYDNPLNLTWQPVLHGNIFVKIKEITFKLPSLIPLYGLLWSMGFMFWIVLILVAVCLRFGRAENIVSLLPFIFLTLTLCIATPVANEFRYSYPLAFALPLLLMVPFVQSKY